MSQGRKNPLWFGFSERLRRMRRALGCSMRSINTAAGRNWPLSSYEAGQYSPRVGTAEELAAALGVPPVWLAFGDEGAYVFEYKRPRSPVPSDPPIPQLGGGIFAKRFAGMGERLAQRRAEVQLGLRHVAELAGLSGQAIILVERGRQASLDTIERLAMALVVAPGWLAFGEGEVGEIDVEECQRAKAQRRHTELTELLCVKVVDEEVLHGIAQHLMQGRAATETFKQIREWTISYADRCLYLVVDIPAGRRPEPILHAIRTWMQKAEVADDAVH